MILKDLYLKIKLKQKDEQGNMGLAIMIAILVLGLAITMVAATSNNLKNGRVAVNKTDNVIGAESALENALNLINSPNVSETHTNMPINTYNNIDSSARGILVDSNNQQQAHWLWYAQKNNEKLGTYDIISMGFQNTPSDPNTKKIVTTVRPLEVEQAVYDGTTPSYEFSRNSLSNLGMYSGANLVLNSGSKIGSYTTKVPTKNDVNGTVTPSLNGYANLNTGSDVSLIEGLNFYGNGALAAANNKCSVLNNCKDIPQTNIFNKINVFEAQNAKLNTKCPAAPTTYPNWIASTYASAANATLVLDPNSLAPCYNAVVFDRNVVLANNANTDNPAIFNAKGNVVVNPNISVNEPNTAFTNSGSRALVINASGLTVNHNATGMPKTRIFADSVILKDCAIGGTNTSIDASAEAQYYGSLICGSKITVNKNAILGIDKANAKFIAPSNGKIFWNVVQKYQYIDGQ